MASYIRMMALRMVYLLTAICFFIDLSEGVISNCTEPDCQEELEAAICPPDSIPDLNSPDNGCICSNKCPPEPPCDPPSYLHLLNPATGQPSNCCDEFECRSPAVQNCSDVICETVEQLPCPSDSYRLPSVKSPEECCSLPQGCQCKPEPCRPIDCKPPLWAKVVRIGDRKPGSCCPLYQCVEKESNSTCTLENGKIVSEGAIWSKSECSELCTCKNGIINCDKNPPCPSIPDGCSKKITPAGKCCPICLDSFEPAQKVCVSAKGEMIKSGETWKEDACTFCACKNGEKNCQAFMCEACANPRYVPHECCPLCDESSVVTLPPHCPALTNCSLRCVRGFVRDLNGCFTCDCQQDVCTLECPQGYAQDKYGNKLCECAKLPQCPPLNCKKNCRHGFRMNKLGCPICKCESCKPLKECSKKCSHGLMTNQNNCPICKCLPAPSNETTLMFDKETVVAEKGRMCSSDDIIFRDDGEMWFDGCRQCYCMAGLEMCSPLLCPATNCPSKSLNTSNCCPVCYGPNEGIKKYMVCGGGDATDTLRMDGEVWSLSSDVKCACRDGRILCHAPSCLPTPCPSESLIKNGLECPHCSAQSLTSLNITSRLTNNCEGHEDVTLWKESNCISCYCDNGQKVCHEEMCDNTFCKQPLHIKGRCCPICLDSLNTNNGIHMFEITESSNKVGSHIGCIVLQNNVTLTYEIGEEWRENDCFTCHCTGQGQTYCTKETCVLSPSCKKYIKTPGVCCHSCIINDAEPENSRHNMVIIIIALIIISCIVIVYLIARQYKTRRQMKLPKYSCPPPQYPYKYVPYEAQSQSLRTSEKSALSPV